MKFFFCGGSNIHQKFNKQNLVYEQRYPYIVSQHFNADHVNEGIPNGSNKRTIRKIFYEYDMNEFDFICIEFTPRSRTEFYNDREKRWINFSLKPDKDKINSENQRLINIYYTEIYNDTHGRLQNKIDLILIEKYLKAIKKPYVLIDTDDSIKKDKHLNYTFDILNYHRYDSHLTNIGHKMIAKDIIKHYENFL